MAAERGGLSSSEAGTAVHAVVDVIAELGDEIELVGESVALKKAPLDPANPPRIDITGAAIPDRGMVGLKLLRRH